ncbi:MAG TPA: VWA domain-containing protein [Alphaproteobacteria bacterium]|nr:VWA domain-containing protein [Alphaproteobacteria bacterium]
MLRTHSGNDRAEQFRQCARTAFLCIAVGAGFLHAQVPSANTAGAPAQQKQAAAAGDNERGITLYVSVTDSKHNSVNDLKAPDFAVDEDGRRQEITAFSHEDLPVSMGILVDNSGSMREKRAAVAQAMLNLVKASNPGSEAFVVNFSDLPYLDQDFTNDLTLLREALNRLDSRGGTALRDAVIASADHLSKAAKYRKRVLVLVTDGEDNESQESLEKVMRTVGDENGPVLYAIGILGSEGRERRARQTLEELAKQTGGLALFPKSLSAVNESAQRIARDIRGQYSLTYRSSHPGETQTLIHVKVSTLTGKFEVRCRPAYFSAPHPPK